MFQQVLQTERCWNRTLLVDNHETITAFTGGTGVEGCSHCCIQLRKLFSAMRIIPSRLSIFFFGVWGAQITNIHELPPVFFFDMSFVIFCPKIETFHTCSPKNDELFPSTESLWHRLFKSDVLNHRHQGLQVRHRCLTRTETFRSIDQTLVGSGCLWSFQDWCYF